LASAAAEIASTALILLFREEVFPRRFPAESRRPPDRRCRRDSNEVETGKYSGFWLLKKLEGLVETLDRFVLFPAFTSESFRDWPWEIVSSHSSATAPDSHGNSSHRSTTQTDKELPPEVAACAWTLKIYLSGRRLS
jgi:hypothetical protein